jgi:hypothetical protein
VQCGVLRSARSAGRRGTAKKTRRAQILIDVRPVNAKPTAGELPVGALCGCGIQEAREPEEGHGDCAPVNVTAFSCADRATARLASAANLCWAAPVGKGPGLSGFWFRLDDQTGRCTQRRSVKPSCSWSEGQKGLANSARGANERDAKSVADQPSSRKTASMLLPSGSMTKAA